MVCGCRWHLWFCLVMRCRSGSQAKRMVTLRRPQSQWIARNTQKTAAPTSVDEGEAAGGVKFAYRGTNFDSCSWRVTP